jgi:hypothetical protein
LGEHLLCTQEVIGSIPFTSTRKHHEVEGKKNIRLRLQGESERAEDALSLEP